MHLQEHWKNTNEIKNVLTRFIQNIHKPKKIDNKPLIYYPITAAKKSKVIDDIFVSTDSSKIAHVSKRYGAQVPFLRKKKFAGDFVTTEDTLKNALVEFEKFKTSNKTKSFKIMTKDDTRISGKTPLDIKLKL